MTLFLVMSGEEVLDAFYESKNAEDEKLAIEQSDKENNIEKVIYIKPVELT